MTEEPLLHVEHLSVRYRRRGMFAKPVTVIDDVSFTVRAGETVGLVGESGAGKSTIGRAVLGLVPTSGGVIRFEGVDLAGPDGTEARSRLQVVFQDPYGSLNPSRRIGATLREPLEVRHGLSSRAAGDRITDMLQQVELPADAVHRLPRGFSGGQRQRIGIARALAPRPRLVVCDEATSALDVLTRENVVDLLAQIQDETGVAYLFIAHDLPLVAGFADRVVVLYRGRVMESGPARVVGDDPRHPYTRALVLAVPGLDPDEQRRRRSARRELRATVDAAEPPADGCPFAPRCPSAADVCWTRRPRELPVEDRTVACHLFDPDVDHPEAGPRTGGAGQ
ncbi:oligopeptide/dipeptide ABC transporter ATP-binding protein [Streptomyces sp. NPDC047043]|uniref:ABC transporter ATP-binding protein n=1 Tax=Streptomyces sp. NPDC047043 TaxID=3154497 RepID=UPI0033C6BBDE